MKNLEMKAVERVASLMDTSKLKALGWIPLYTVCQGLKETYIIKRQENAN